VGFTGSKTHTGFMIKKISTYYINNHTCSLNVSRVRKRNIPGLEMHDASRAACIGLCRPVCRPALACVAVVGPCWPLLAFVGCHGPALVFVSCFC
jgi:hypothetical protein